VGWFVALLVAFPIFWMTLAAFKTEIGAVATPPELFFWPTLENFAEVRSRADYPVFAMNSIVISVTATFFAIVIALPAAYAMAFHPSRHTKDLLLWMLSTKMMPAIGVLVPIYLLAYRELHLLDNLPIIIWMLYTFFKEIPKSRFSKRRAWTARGCSTR
jgi:sorbitol/mannitol transport system permease protein